MKSWAIRFKDRAPTPLELTVLTKEFHQDLVIECVSPDLFQEMVLLVRRTTRFFPCMADMLAHREEAQATIDRRNEAKKQKQIPEHTNHGKSAGSEEFASMCIKNIKLMLSGKLSQDDAVARNTPKYKNGGIDIEYHRNVNHDHDNVKGEKIIEVLAKGMSL